MTAPQKVYADKPYDDLHAVRFTEGNRIMCDAGYSGTTEGDIANARRIAACWNACAGVRTDVLEQAGTRQDWCDLMQELESDRDAARALLAELMDTELADIACAGSLAPVEDLLGRIKTFVEGKS